MEFVDRGEDGSPTRRQAQQARDRAEAAARRAAKQRAAGGQACAGDRGRDPLTSQARRLALDLVAPAERTRINALRQHAEAAMLLAHSCERTARAHRRLAKAGSGDPAEHLRRVREYRQAARLFREAAAWYREALRPGGGGLDAPGLS